MILGDCMLQQVTTHSTPGEFSSASRRKLVQLAVRVNEIAWYLILRVPINKGNRCRVPITLIGRYFDVNDVSNRALVIL